MIVTTIFLISVILYILNAKAYVRGSKSLGAIVTALFVILCFGLALYIEIQNIEIDKLTSPCPEYEKVNIEYYQLKTK